MSSRPDRHSGRQSIDLVGALGVLACPGGPVIKTYMGRPEPWNAAPVGLLLNPFSPVPDQTARFADMGFTVREFMALLGAHTTAKQRQLDPTQFGFALDSTVDLWDVRVYFEALNSTIPPGVFSFPPYAAFATDPTTAKDWARFVYLPPPATCAIALTSIAVSRAREYASAHASLSIVGNDLEVLTKCTEILPLAIDLKDPAVGSVSGKSPTDPVTIPSSWRLQFSSTAIFDCSQ
ncbi:heme peroxidase [Mycena vulgaris]|nr:heme peroxidase [Mycena vulgaris]